MKRSLWLGLLLIASACDDARLHVAPDPPDAGFFADASPLADAGFPVDAAMLAPDAEPALPAREPIYIHTGESLFSYDPVSNAATVIGPFHDQNGMIEDMVDIAIDLNGRMFGGTRDKKIYFINASNAACEYRFDFDDILHGLTFLSDGSLVVAGERVSIVNPVTGAVQIEILAAQEYETSGDIVGLPDGKLYWTVRNPDAQSGNGDGVVRIHPISGRIDWLGEATVKSIYGLGYSDNKLYGFSDKGRVVTIDPSNGAVLQSRVLEGRWWGATTNPVHW
jgi:hypothetical protein